MTTVISLYGGPGTGKSTSAAYIFNRLKKRDINCELVREYVKDWAWEKRSIRDWDQYYFFGKQVRRESMLYGRVDYIVTDAPVSLSLFYAEKFSPPHILYGIREAVNSFYEQCSASGDADHVHVFLTRTKTYNPAGRFQTEEQAKEMDVEMSHFLTRNFGITQISGTDDGDLDGLIDKIVGENTKRAVQRQSVIALPCPACGAVAGQDCKGVSRFSWHVVRKG